MADSKKPLAKKVKVEIQKYLFAKKREIENALKRFLPNGNEFPSKIHRAIRYSVLNGGKRIRPILVVAACEAAGGKGKAVLPAACALELIHCSTLILDDLPCIDNDDYRRGKLTCHKVFGEDIAVLSANAMLSLAFEVIGNSAGVMPKDMVKIVTRLAHSVGSRGLIGGETADIMSEDGRWDEKTLKYIHSHKTAELIEASLYAGGVIAGADKRQLEALTDFGRKMGLVFQIADDVLDVTSDFKKLGKRTKKDAIQKKATYPALYGLDKSIAIMHKLKKEAVSSLSVFKQRANVLNGIADYIINRSC